MTDTQLYLAIGIPGVLALINLAIILTLFTALHSDIKELREQIRMLVGAVNELDKRITRMEIKLRIQE